MATLRTVEEIKQAAEKRARELGANVDDYVRGSIDGYWMAVSDARRAMQMVRSSDHVSVASNRIAVG